MQCGRRTHVLPIPETGAGDGALSVATALEGRWQMPAKSKAQQMAAGAALAAKRDHGKVDELKGASRSMYKSMDEKELHDMAATPRKGKPKHKDA